MYTIYYYNESDRMFCIQTNFPSLKEAKEQYKKQYRGYITNEYGTILKRYGKTK
ncbi:MAG: hypothetical protein RSE25_04745 [Bacteroidales bacterium]